jgi:predicted secreted protein
MAQSPGYLATVKHATTLGGSYTVIDGIKSVDDPSSREKIDISDFKDASPRRKFIQGMFDPTTLSLEGDRIVGDTQQDALKTAHDAGTSVFITVLPDGTNGYKGEYVVDSFNVKAGIGGAVSLSVQLTMSGAPTAVP